MILLILRVRTTLVPTVRGWRRYPVEDRLSLSSGRAEFLERIAGEHIGLILSLPFDDSLPTVWVQMESVPELVREHGGPRPACSRLLAEGAQPRAVSDNNGRGNAKAAGCALIFVDYG